MVGTKNHRLSSQKGFSPLPQAGEGKGFSGMMINVNRRWNGMDCGAMK
jgi:hypothetical protein